MNQLNATATTGPLDLVWEVENIASLIGRTKRQTLHLLSTGQLPADKVGGRWVTSRARLTRHFEGTAATSPADANA